MKLRRSYSASKFLTLNCSFGKKTVPQRYQKADFSVQDPLVRATCLSALRGEYSLKFAPPRIQKTAFLRGVNKGKSTRTLCRRNQREPSHLSLVKSVPPLKQSHIPAAGIIAADSASHFVFHNSAWPHSRRCPQRVSTVWGPFLASFFWQES